MTDAPYQMLAFEKTDKDSGSGIIPAQIIRGHADDIGTDEPVNRRLIINSESAVVKCVKIN